MKIVKFRGKDLYGGEWWHGSFAYFPDSQSSHIIPCGTYKNEEVTCDFVEVNLETVGQFIGLLDKNGKEIYEGDIVRYYDDIDDEFAFVAVVYHPQTCSFCGERPGCELFGINSYWQFEVIGNIYDTPELINNQR